MDRWTRRDVEADEVDKSLSGFHFVVLSVLPPPPPPPSALLPFASTVETLDVV